VWNLNLFGSTFGEHNYFQIKWNIIFENNSCLIWLGYIKVMGKKKVLIFLGVLGKMSFCYDWDDWLWNIFKKWRHLVLPPKFELWWTFWIYEPKLVTITQRLSLPTLCSLIWLKVELRKSIHFLILCQRSSTTFFF
jgi:hypothetical protein